MWVAVATGQRRFKKHSHRTAFPGFRKHILKTKTKGLNYLIVPNLLFSFEIVLSRTQH